MSLIWPVSAPCGVSPDETVKIEEFTVSGSEACLYNVTNMPIFHMMPGTYKRLMIKIGNVFEVVMSNTLMEMKTNRQFVHSAKGNVLINGLGLGMVVEKLLTNPEIDHITVVEFNPVVIAMVGSQFIGNPKVTIVESCAFTYSPPKGVKYDYVWHDIWTDVARSNLPEMTRLKRKYAKRAGWQGCWAQDLCKTMPSGEM